MAGVPQAEADARHRLPPLAEPRRPHLLYRFHGVEQRVDRGYFLSAAPLVAAIELLHLHLLDVGRVRQHDLAKVDRGR